jgi:hypothetical protein
MRSFPATTKQITHLTLWTSPFFSLSIYIQGNNIAHESEHFLNGS